MKWNRLARRGNPARRKRLVDRSRGIKCMVTIKRCEHEISARLANLHRFEGSKTLSVCLHKTGSKYFSVINAQTGFHGAVNWILIKISLFVRILELSSGLASFMCLTREYFDAVKHESVRHSDCSTYRQDSSRRTSSFNYSPEN
jgi:hypothetical protein